MEIALGAHGFRLVQLEFEMPGVEVVRAWTRKDVEYQPGSSGPESDGSTSLNGLCSQL